MAMLRIVLAAAFALAFLPAHADQKDKRLDELFAALAKAQKPEIAEPITTEIWKIWLETDSPTTELLYERSAGMIAQAVGELGDQIGWDDERHLVLVGD